MAEGFSAACHLEESNTDIFVDGLRLPFTLQSLAVKKLLGTSGRHIPEAYKVLPEGLQKIALRVLERSDRFSLMMELWRTSGDYFKRDDLSRYRKICENIIRCRTAVTLTKAYLEKKRRRGEKVKGALYTPSKALLVEGVPAGTPSPTRFQVCGMCGDPDELWLTQLPSSDGCRVCFTGCRCKICGLHLHGCCTSPAWMSSFGRKTKSGGVCSVCVERVWGDFSFLSGEHVTSSPEWFRGPPRHIQFNDDSVEEYCSSDFE